MYNNRFVIWLILVIAPFLIMIVVNEMHETPSVKRETRCSRYCHNNGCPHIKEQLKKNPSSWKKMIKKTFDWNVGALHKNSIGLSYQKINILIYILLFPLVMAILLWGAIRKST